MSSTDWRFGVSTPIAFQGIWWLPDHPEHKVGGWLTFDDDTGGHLILGGTLRLQVWDDNVRPDGSIQRVLRAHTGTDHRLYPVVHGQRGLTAYSLVNCFQTKVSGHRSPTETEEVTVNSILEGAWFEEESDLLFERAKINLRQLTTFVGQSGLSSEFPFTENTQDARYSVVSSKRLPPISLEANDFAAEFVHGLEQSGDQFHEIVMKQQWVLEISTNKSLPIQAFLDLMSDVQDLVSIASGNTACVDGFEFEHPDVLENALNGTPMDGLRKPLPYRSRWSQQPQNDALVNKHQFYFTLEDLDGTDGLSRWLKVAHKYRTELGRAMATRYSSAMFLEDRITNLCAALESLDAVERGISEPFADHIKSCVAQAGAPFAAMLAGDSEQWSMQVKEIRHDLAHHRKGYRANETPVNHLVAEQLFWLFTFCILRISGASPEVFESISRHAQILWLSDRALKAQTH